MQRCGSLQYSEAPLFLEIPYVLETADTMLVNPFGRNFFALADNDQIGLWLPESYIVSDLGQLQKDIGQLPQCDCAKALHGSTGVMCVLLYSM